MGPAGPFLNDHLMHLVLVSFNFKSCVVIPLIILYITTFSQRQSFSFPHLSSCLRDPHDLVFHGHAWFCLCRIMTECRNVLSKLLVECQTAGNMLVSEDSTCLLKAHTTRWHMSSHILTLLLSDVLFGGLSSKLSLYIFTGFPACLLLPVPRPQKKGQGASKGFSLCILRIAALCCGGAHIVAETCDRAGEHSAPAQAACVLVGVSLQRNTSQYDGA